MDRGPILLAGPASQAAKHTSAATYPHALGQRDFRGHGEGHFHRSAFRERSLGIEEDPAGTDILSETSYGSVLNLNRDRQVDLESLTGATFHPNRLCTHRSHPCSSGQVRGRAAEQCYCSAVPARREVRSLGAWSAPLGRLPSYETCAKVLRECPRRPIP
jgi:hypothetical protein